VIDGSDEERIRKLTEENTKRNSMAYNGDKLLDNRQSNIIAAIASNYP
jgi:hypothetical protein